MQTARPARASRRGEPLPTRPGPRPQGHRRQEGCPLGAPRRNLWYGGGWSGSPELPPGRVRGLRLAPSLGDSWGIAAEQT
eukprot:6590219-Pyramimonas_sp.AAC.1